eukprot:8111665-Alexandrium_andersonii.AAC.1
MCIRDRFSSMLGIAPEATPNGTATLHSRYSSNCEVSRWGYKRSAHDGSVRDAPPRRRLAVGG